MRKIFDKQKEIQQKLGLGVGSENIKEWYGALTAASIEIGETLNEDTRWKRLINGNMKISNVNRNKVIEETGDILLYLCNACIFYNISYNELLNIVKEKQTKNYERLINLRSFNDKCL